MGKMMGKKMKMGGDMASEMKQSVTGKGKFTGTPEQIAKADKRNAEYNKRKTFFDRLKQIGYKGAMPNL